MNKNLLVFLFSFFCFAAKAQPEILGSHISYKAIDSLTYEVKLTVIRECSGKVAAIKDNLEMHAGSYFVSQQAKLISTRDISAIGDGCSSKTTCYGGALYGFQERVYTTTFTLDQVVDCDVYFVWQGGNRYSNFNTTKSIEYHYNYAYLNYCATKHNSSPVFTNKPSIILQEGSNAQVAIRAIDSIEINDSFSYQFAYPLTDSTVNFKYNSPYDSNQFITYLGAFRDPTQLRYPAGLFLDSITGNLAFRAMKAGEITPYCIETNEYRKINGKMEKIGTIRWDMTFMVVKSLGNKTPSNLTIFDFKNSIDEFLCAEIDNKFSFKSYDADTSDSAYFQLDYSGIKNINFTDSLLTKDQTIYINWKPTQNQLKTIKSPYLITLTAKDNNCDYNVVNSVNIPFYFDQKNQPDFILKDSLFCKENDALLTLDLFNPKKTKYVIWNDSIYYFELAIPKDSLPVSVKIKVIDNSGCSIEKIKKIDHFPNNGLQFSLADSLFCTGENAALTLKTNKPNLIKEINWNDSITTDTFIVSNAQIPSKIELKITDINGCFETKSQVVDYFERTPVVFYFQDSACYNDSSIALKSNINNPKWKGNSIVNNQFYPSKTILENNEIKLLFTDKHQCEDSASKNLHVTIVPVPKVFIQNMNGDVPLNVKLSENSSNTFDTYFWEIKNGSHNFQLHQKVDSLLINDAGKYDVKLTVGINGCTNVFERKDAINALGNSSGIQNYFEGNILIYPNPVYAVLSIKTPKSFENATYQIIDLNGKIILKGILENQITAVQTETLKSGFYFIEIMDGESRIVSKNKLVKY